MWTILLFISLMAGFLYIIGMRVTPHSKAFMLMERCFLGGAMLFVFNAIGTFFGVTLGINLFSSLVAGLLGAPGLVFLMVVKMMG